jgi:hypothetical protein
MPVKNQTDFQKTHRSSVVTTARNDYDSFRRERRRAVTNTDWFQVFHVSSHAENQHAH